MGTNETSLTPRVLVIEDDAGMRKAVSAILSRGNFQVTAVGDPLEVVDPGSPPDADVALLDVSLPHVSGLTLLREFKRQHPDLQVIIMTGNATVQTAVEALKAGASDFLVKPFESIDLVLHTVRRAAEKKALLDRNRDLESKLRSLTPAENFIGESPKMRQVFELIDRVSRSDATVLIQGESGTGKELVAHAIHEKSARAKGPFMAVNCAALPETLLDSELFGHVKGSFTGAATSRRGLFEGANGGTLFLDEIGDMPLPTQVRLLRTLQEGEIRPVGSNEVVKVNVRVIAASHVQLQQAVAAGKFREDLFYRLNVIQIPLPPLRERPTDVPLLAHHFLSVYGRKLGKHLRRISPEALELLVQAPWQGNVRELENVIERAVVLAQGDELAAQDLPPEMLKQRIGSEAEGSALVQLPYPQAKRLAVAAFDRRYLTNMLRRTNGNVTQAAKLSGIDRSNFRRLLRQYSLGRPGDTGDFDDVTPEPTVPPAQA